MIPKGEKDGMMVYRKGKKVVVDEKDIIKKMEVKEKKTTEKRLYEIDLIELERVSRLVMNLLGKLNYE